MIYVITLSVWNNLLFFSQKAAAEDGAARRPPDEATEGNRQDVLTEELFKVTAGIGIARGCKSCFRPLACRADTQTHSLYQPNLAVDPLNPGQVIYYVENKFGYTDLTCQMY